MQQKNWNAGGGTHDQNYGLSDISQGSANYGHVDHGQGARYYGTGNYGGYFGSDSNDSEHDRSHYQPGRDYDTYRGNNQGGDFRNQNDRVHNSGNYGRGPRYGNSNIHGRNYESGGRPNESGNRSAYRGDSYGSRRGGGDRYSGYGAGRASDWEQDRDWWEKTTDEVSSWFGDDEATRRRELDKRYGPHHGKGPKGYIRSDEKIKDDVQERLYNDSFVDASDIEVDVSDGEVTLSGLVDDKQTKRRAEDCIETVSGVKDVSNHLKIKRTSQSTGTD